MIPRAWLILNRETPSLGRAVVSHSQRCTRARWILFVSSSPSRQAERQSQSQPEDEQYAGEHVILVAHLGVIRALAPEHELDNAGFVEAVAEEILARPFSAVVPRNRRVL